MQAVKYISKSLSVSIGLTAILMLGLILQGCAPDAADTQTRMSYEKAIGYTLAQAVEDEISPNSVIVLLPPETSSFVAKQNTARLEGVEKVIDESQISVYTIEAPPQINSGQVGMYVESGRWIKDYGSWANSNDGDALISFVSLNADRSGALVKVLPPTYSLSVVNERVPLEKSALVTSGKLKAYIKYAKDYRPSNKPPFGASIEDVFDTKYRLIDVN